MADLPTDTGFNRPEFTNVNQWIKDLFTQYCGSNVDTDDPTVAGIIAGVISKSDDTLLQYMQGAFNQLFLLRANSSGLDDIGAEWGLTRKQATPSFVNLKVMFYYDDSPINIPAGEAEFSTADAHQFVTLEDINITGQGTDNDGKPLITNDGSKLGIATVQAECLQSGLDTNVAPNTITNPLESLDGFYSVTNPDAASGGTPQETDNLFRKRIYNFRNAGPAFTDNGITSRLRNLPDVEDTKLIDNVSASQTDQYGNPPKSIHVYVLGGDDDEVAKNLFNCLYPTTHTVGSITKTVISDDGMRHQVNFDHAKSVNVSVHLTLHVDPNKFNSDNGIDNIKNRIINTYFNQLKMGENVLYSRLFGPAYQEPGVNYVQAALGTDPNNLSNKDVPINDFELGVTDVNHINIDLDSDNNVPS